MRERKIADQDSDDHKSRVDKMNRQTLLSLRTVFGAIFISGAVYVGLYMVACDDDSLSCGTVYDWPEIALAALIVLGVIVGAAAAVLVLLKLVRGGRPTGANWSQSPLQVNKSDTNEPASKQD